MVDGVRETVLLEDMEAEEPWRGPEILVVLTALFTGRILGGAATDRDGFPALDISVSRGGAGAIVVRSSHPHSPLQCATHC